MGCILPDDDVDVIVVSTEELEGNAATGVLQNFFLAFLRSMIDLSL